MSNRNFTTPIHNATHSPGSNPSLLLDTLLTAPHATTLKSGKSLFGLLSCCLTSTSGSAAPSATKSAALNIGETAMPAPTKWSAITQRLANTPDRFMQMHVLEGNGANYLATTNRGKNQGFAGEPSPWEGKVQFLKPLPGTKYGVTEMMSGKAVGEFTRLKSSRSRPRDT